MHLDPAVTNPQHYAVVLENDRVRVLLYRDRPGEQTTPHRHPDSVMDTLSSFERGLRSGGGERDVNTGDTETHVLFVELKEPAAGPTGEAGATGLGPQLT